MQNRPRTRDELQFWVCESFCPLFLNIGGLLCACPPADIRKIILAIWWWRVRDNKLGSWHHKLKGRWPMMRFSFVHEWIFLEKNHIRIYFFKTTPFNFQLYFELQVFFKKLQICGIWCQQHFLGCGSDNAENIISSMTIGPFMIMRLRHREWKCS